MEEVIPRPDARRAVRWRPALLTLAVAGVVLAFVWLVPWGFSQKQDRVTATATVAVIAAVVLLVWALLFSRLRARTRLAVLAAVAALAALGPVFLEVRGYTGDLVPILGWRGGGEVEPTVPVAAAPAAGRVEPLNAYPQFLGPDRDATVRGVRLARDWDARPPELLWRRAVTGEEAPSSWTCPACLALACSAARAVHALTHALLRA